MGSGNAYQVAMWTGTAWSNGNIGTAILNQSMRLGMSNNANNQMVVTDSNGVNFRAYQSTAQAFTANTATTVNYQTQQWFNGAAGSYGSGIYYCPITGQYQVYACLGFGGATAGGLGVSHNGTVTAIGKSAVLVQCFGYSLYLYEVQDLIYANASDTISIQGYFTAAVTSYPASNYSYLIIARVG
jgi:hypothetical protein